MSLLESKFNNVGIDRATYHDGNLEGISICCLFQNSNEIFNSFEKLIFNITKNETQWRKIYNITERYIDICTLFERLFLLPGTKSDNLTDGNY